MIPGGRERTAGKKDEVAEGTELGQLRQEKKKGKNYFSGPRMVARFADVPEDNI